MNGIWDVLSQGIRWSADEMYAINRAADRKRAALVYVRRKARNYGAPITNVQALAAANRIIYNRRNETIQHKEFYD